MMKVIVQDKYGSPDVLQLKDIDKPVVKDDGVLVRVHAAAVNIGDWHLPRGMPYAVRLVSGLLKPRHDVPGLDIAGQVNAAGMSGLARTRPTARGLPQRVRVSASAMGTSRAGASMRALRARALIGAKAP